MLAARRACVALGRQRLSPRQLCRSVERSLVPAAFNGQPSAAAVGGWARASASLVPLRPSSFRESQEQVALSERQEAFVLERLPRDWDEEDICRCLHGAGLDLGDKPRQRVLLMRTRLGVSIGRAMVKVRDHVPHVNQAFPDGTIYRPVDIHDIEAFVEQCERLLRLSDDLRRLARPENLFRVVTITEVPENYGRRDVASVVEKHCGVTVDPRDIVFRFKRWGRQSDTCYVLCPTEQAADHCVAQIQELAVPKRAAYGTLFGAAFLWSSRATLFMSHPDLDFLLQDSKFWIFTTGWQEDMTVEEFLLLMNQMSFFPRKAVRHPIQADSSSAFFMQFDSMFWTKHAMRRLRRLKWRWRMRQSITFFAYPRRIDIHRAHEDRYDDEDSAADSDIDEPVDY
mmetsp:Transcript_59808/g.129566  ORF Transcript_59808/g.129566 Transcript_59808/m.129566 type:complete len:398 (-) Transcript_59808:71-1264(-)